MYLERKQFSVQGINVVEEQNYAVLPDLELKLIGFIQLDGEGLNTKANIATTTYFMCLVHYKTKRSIDSNET